MLEEKDLKKIGEVVEEKIKKEITEVRKEMKESNNSLFKEMKDEFGNVRKEMKESNNSLFKEMKDESKKIIEGICEFIEQNILPVIDETRDELKREINEINSKMTTMVTIDYLDEKLFDLKGDLIVLMRKEDKKVIRLVEILQAKNILNKKEAEEIFSLELFAQII
jgi:hypothetical protein